ncbi:M60 family metallopeptidase [Microbacterium sp. LMI1-1-1.1]|uniref:M60 family metallopeptidase n=1 Tax=Microbacterium sp. LMI1-1-1.1 TaxID=3135223 RepID=UPI0034677897
MTLLPTRRTVLRAAAWAVPAVTTVASAPAAAATLARGWTVTMSRSWLYPDEVATVWVTSSDGAGRPRRGEPLTLSLGDRNQGEIGQPSGVTDSEGRYRTTMRVRSGAAAASGTLNVSSASGGAVTAFEIREPAVVVHDDTGASTRVIALPHGSQSETSGLENRAFSHSDPQPTGRHVRSGETLEVVVDSDAPDTLSLAIGTRGPWRDFNGSTEQDLSIVPLKKGRQSITAPQDGIVFVTNSSTETAGGMTISGGRPHPVWVKDRTKTEEFAGQLTRWSTAPVVELVGDRALVDVQRRVIDDMAATSTAWDPADVVMRLDRIVAYTSDVYGLSRAAVGIARKRPGRVDFSGPDTGVGWAFATEQWLSFHVDTGATKDLLVTPDGWGTWHEVGHTFQTPDYTWSGLTEVTVNISSLALQQRLTGKHRLDEDQDSKDRIRRYFEQPVGDRDHAKLTEESAFYGLFLFDQLRQSFGEGFYPAVSQAYRVRRIRGQARPSSDQEKRDLFAQVASQVADRDLSPFFAEWGVPLSASVKKSLASYPALQNKIWTAIDSRDAHREREVGYDLPVGSLSSKTGSLNLGERDGASGVVSGASTLGGSSSTVVAQQSSAPEVSPTAGRLLAVLEAPDGTQEVLWHDRVPVTATSALQFHGLSDVVGGWLGISRDGSRLVATSTGEVLHEYFTGKPYYKITVQDADGTELRTVTVNGDDTHDKVVTALDGTAVGDGYRLVVEAQEPSRVRVWQNSERSGTLSSTPQTLVVRNGRFEV